MEHQKDAELNEKREMELFEDKTKAIELLDERVDELEKREAYRRGYEAAQNNQDNERVHKK